MKVLLNTLIIVATLFFLAGCVSPEIRTARIATNERDWDRVIKSAQQELERNPSSAEAYYRLGISYENLLDWEKMSYNFDRSLDISNEFASRITEHRKKALHSVLLNVEGFNKEAEKAEEEGNEDKAIELYKKAIAYVDTSIIIDPKNLALFREGAFIAYYGNMLEKAIDYCDSYIALENENEKNLVVREILLMSYQRQQNDSKIIDVSLELMSLIDEKSDTTETYLISFEAAVGAYLRTEQFEKAEELLRVATEKYPNETKFQIILSTLYIEKEDYESAKQVYSNVLKIDPNNLTANVNLGALYAIEEKWKEAIVYLEKARSLDPFNRIALTNLMAAYSNLEDNENFQIILKLYQEKYSSK